MGVPRQGRQFVVDAVAVGVEQSVDGPEVDAVARTPLERGPRRRRRFWIYLC
jgi:hypothetical protein